MPILVYLREPAYAPFQFHVTAEGGCDLTPLSRFLSGKKYHGTKLIKGVLESFDGLRMRSLVEEFTGYRYVRGDREGTPEKPWIFKPGMY